MLGRCWPGYPRHRPGRFHRRKIRWLSDEANFWDYKVKIPANVDDLSFGSDQAVPSIVEGYDILVKVSNGKIINDVVHNLASGVTADSIYFELWFEDLVPDPRFKKILTRIGLEK